MREVLNQRSPGTADFLPTEALRLESTLRELETFFKKQNYQPVITPLFESLANFKAGVNADTFNDTFRLIDPLTGETIALRPDMTPQVARLVATQFHEIDPPYRLYYTGRVVRLGSHQQGEQREFFQAGLELMGDETPEADAEVMLMALNSLESIGIKDLKIEIGHIGYVQALLNGAKLTQEQSTQYLKLLHHKERSTLRTLVKTLELNKDYERALLTLPELFGGPEILNHAADLITSLPLPDAIAAVETTKSIVEDLNTNGMKEKILIDFGDVRDHDYYTGVMFQGFSPTSSTPLVVGGRYDHLLKTYGRDLPATGCAMNVNNIMNLQRGEQ